MAELKSYPSIKRLGHDSNSGILDGGHVVMKEKMDGANFRFTYYPEEDRIVFGSRNIEYWNDGNQEITDSDRRWFKINSYLNKIPFTKQRKVEPQDDVDSTFDHAIEFVREQVDVSAIKHYEQMLGPLVFYGEAMHPHTLEYDWDNTPRVIGFDVYSIEHEEFLEWSASEKIFNEMCLPTVPTVYEGEITEAPADLTWDGDIAIPDSQYRDGTPEGIVIRNEDTDQTAKYRTDKFKEMHKSQSATNSDDYEPSDGEMLAQQFATEARVLKMIHKYEDRGIGVEMSVMEELWRDVFDDIVDEEYETIFLGNYTIDTKDFRSEVASITADVLQRYLARPDESVLNEVEGGA